MKEYFLKKQWNTLLLVLSALFVLASCDDSSDEGGEVTAPKIIQSEEILDNPITLAFSWEAVANAVEYKYQLEAVKETGNEVIVSGSTKGLSVEIASTKEAELFYSTDYVFILRAVSSDASVVSEPSEARVTTSGGPIALSVENITYRSALLKGVPEDKNMLYQFAQIPVEKYLSYDSDMAFIEDYDYGYYKAMAVGMPWIPWYGFMQEGSQQGDYTYETSILSPNKDYVLYAYGVEFDMENAENPVKVVTPLIKHFFSTPEWKATSDCSFDVNVDSQELVVIENEIEPGEVERLEIANVKVKVTPSDASEKYYVAFAEKNMLDKGYGGDIYSFAFDAVYSEETYGGVSDWASTDMLSSGEQVITSMDFGWGLYPGTDYKILVFGVNSKGLVTTSIATVDFTTVGTATGTETGVRSAAMPLKKGLGAKKSVNVVDRM